MVPPESSADEIELWKKTRPSAGDRSPLSPAAGQERRFLHSPARANLLRHLDFAGREVLELGAAGGGLSRFLAAAAARLVVAETEPEQRQLLEERLRDLPQVRVGADPLTLESVFYTYQALNRI